MANSVATQGPFAATTRNGAALKMLYVVTMPTSNVVLVVTTAALPLQVAVQTTKSAVLEHVSSLASTLSILSSF
jgi:hypothetical protein